MNEYSADLEALKLMGESKRNTNPLGAIKAFEMMLSVPGSEENWDIEHGRLRDRLTLVHFLALHSELDSGANPAQTVFRDELTPMPRIIQNAAKEVEDVGYKVSKLTQVPAPYGKEYDRWNRQITESIGAAELNTIVAATLNLQEIIQEYKKSDIKLYQDRVELAQNTLVKLEKRAVAFLVESGVNGQELAIATHLTLGKVTKETDNYFQEITGYSVSTVLLNLSPQEVASSCKKLDLSLPAETVINGYATFLQEIAFNGIRYASNNEINGFQQEKFLTDSLIGLESIAKTLSLGKSSPQMQVAGARVLATSCYAAHDYGMDAFQSELSSVFERIGFPLKRLIVDEEIEKIHTSDQTKAKLQLKAKQAGFSLTIDEIVTKAKKIGAQLNTVFEKGPEELPDAQFIQELDGLIREVSIHDLIDDIHGISQEPKNILAQGIYKTVDPQSVSMKQVIFIFDAIATLDFREGEDKDLSNYKGSLIAEFFIQAVAKKYDYLSISEYLDAWSDIRQAFEQSTSYFKQRDDSQLLIPWKNLITDTAKEIIKMQIKDYDELNSLAISVSTVDAMIKSDFYLSRQLEEVAKNISSEVDRVAQLEGFFVISFFLQEHADSSEIQTRICKELVALGESELVLDLLFERYTHLAALPDRELLLLIDREIQTSKQAKKVRSSMQQLTDDSSSRASLGFTLTAIEFFDRMFSKKGNSLKLLQDLLSPEATQSRILKAFNDFNRADLMECAVDIYQSGGEAKELVEHLAAARRIWPDDEPRFGDFLSAQSRYDRVCSSTISERDLLTRTLLSGQDGILHNEEQRSELVQILIDQALDKTADSQESTSLLSEVIAALVKVTPTEDLTLQLLPILSPRLFPQIKDEKIWEKEKSNMHPEIRKHISANIDHTAYESSLKNNINTLLDFYFYGHPDHSESDAQLIREQLEARPAIEHQKLGPLDFAVQFASRLGAPGVRFLQLLGQFVELSEEEQRTISSAYDAQHGQSKTTAFDTIERTDPVLNKELLRILDELGGGSLYTTYLAEFDDGNEYALRVTNPNALYRTKRVLGIVRKAVVELKKQDARYEVADQIVELVEQWILAELKDSNFIDDDQKFYDRHNQWRPDAWDDASTPHYCPVNN